MPNKPVVYIVQGEIGPDSATRFYALTEDCHPLNRNGEKISEPTIEDSFNTEIEAISHFESLGYTTTTPVNSHGGYAPP